MCPAQDFRSNPGLCSLKCCRQRGTFQNPSLHHRPRLRQVASIRCTFMKPLRLAASDALSPASALGSIHLLHDTMLPGAGAVSLISVTFGRRQKLHWGDACRLTPPVTGCSAGSRVGSRVTFLTQVFQVGDPMGAYYHPERQPSSSLLRMKKLKLRRGRPVQGHAVRKRYSARSSHPFRLALILCSTVLDAPSW